MTNSSPPTYKLYKYDPSLAAAVIFCLLYLCTTIWHCYQMWRNKTWFLIWLVIGGLCKFHPSILFYVPQNLIRFSLTGEFVGYAARSVSANSPSGQYRLMPFIVQNTYILIAPALFSATIYMTLGRIIRLIDGDGNSLVRGSRLTAFFLLGDVFCFLMQGGGMC